MLANSDDIKLIQPNFSQFTTKTIKILSGCPIDRAYTSLYESAFRLMKNLALSNMLSIEKVSQSGFINKLDQFLMNDILYQYICICIDKICEKNYYKFSIIQNESLINKLLMKLLENKNVQLVKYLIQVFANLTEDNSSLCIKINSKQLIDNITSYIRFYDQDIKILAINLLVNIQSQINGVVFHSESIIIYSLSILLSLIRESDEKTKIRITNTITIILKKGIEMQNIFFNLDGIDIFLKDLRGLFTSEKIKEFEEAMKNLKNKRKRSETKEDDHCMSTSLDATHSDTDEYKRSILDVLAACSANKEESRRKIIDSKELCIMLSQLEEINSKIVLASANLMLSLSRANDSSKKFLHEYDINGLLFRIANHKNIDVQIISINALCNFLLDNHNSNSELMDCITRLVKIFKNAKHPKIRYNSIFAIKNIVFYCNNKGELKRAIMKKVGYDTILSLLDEEEQMQEQALIIFRVLLYKAADDIEEVFSNVKSKLIKKVYEKLISSDNTDILTQCLYVLCNISTGNDKQKLCIVENGFIQVITDILVRELYLEYF